MALALAGLRRLNVPTTVADMVEGFAADHTFRGLAPAQLRKTYHTAVA
jgi:hypothetical protein